MGKLALLTGPKEEPEGGLWLRLEFRQAQNECDEIGGQFDQEFGAVIGEIGLHGGGIVEQREDPGYPDGVFVIFGERDDVGVVSEGFDPFQRRKCGGGFKESIRKGESCEF